MIYVKVSKDKNISRWTDQENLMSDEMASKFCIKMNEVIDRGKRSKALCEVKTVKNISKNPQSFLEISAVKKECI